MYYYIRVSQFFSLILYERSPFFIELRTVEIFEIG